MLEERLALATERLLLAVLNESSDVLPVVFVVFL